MEKKSRRPPTRDPFVILFGTFSSWGRPWGLQMVVWGAIRFVIGFRIRVQATLEAFGTRNDPSIDAKPARYPRADQK